VSASTPTTPESVFTGNYSPLFQVQRHVLSFLKWRFSLLPQGTYRWAAESESSPEQKESEIFLSADTPIRPSVVGKRPAITITRSQAAFSGVGIGDLAFVDLSTGAKARMDMIPTNIMINVLSRLPVEAENLAWFAATQIFAFREEIVKEEPSLLYLGARPMIGPPSPAGSLVGDSTDFEWCVVVVSLPAFLHHGMHTLPLNRPIVQSIEVTATTQEQPAVVEPLVPLQGTAVMQPEQSDADRQGAVDGSAQLPQEGSDVAQSTEPLTVKIQTR
jgi:hypothetical protein